eukprot:CAMPEP_0170788344 /NCGR_PEP_ID=MMETSP0733-20121128/18886_1 /TAXON_ID=186038 /ORGANISM="Fragilariopsis kerguelensis, Strain L26-C5" /LENGTH=569 /DNA_ID=CAMNT_0011134851 /DNA_START=76 /DNA_END=1785 /DNA_ORIENTATION=+
MATMCKIDGGSSLTSSSSRSSSDAITTMATIAGTETIEDGSSFRIKSCSPQGLVDALISTRGKEETIKILRESCELVVSSSSLLVSPDDKRISIEGGDGDNNNNRNKTDDEDDDDESNRLGDELLSGPIETSFISPRIGKFSLQFYENGLIATKVNDSTIKIILASTNATTKTVVSHALLFPKAEDCKAIVANKKNGTDAKQKKTNGNLVLLRLSSAISVPKHKSPIQQLCFALPSEKKLGRPIGPSLVKSSSSSLDTDSNSNSNIDDDINKNKQPTEEWGKVIKQALGRGEGTDGEGVVVAIVRPGTNFKSHQSPNTSSTTAGMPFVNCYLGVNDGILYPLKEGLLFYKPPRFLPRSDLHSIACGRGGGDSSRYVDLVVQCTNKDNGNQEEEEQETVEFTNINREENNVINSYIHDVLIPAMTEDADRTITTSTKGGDKNFNGDDIDNMEVEVEAIVEVDDDNNDDDESTESEYEEVQGEENDNEDEDDDDFKDPDDEGYEEESDNEDSYSDDDDDDDEGITVVEDELAQELVKEKRRKLEEESATESEDDDEDSGRPRLSKRLRREA